MWQHNDPQSKYQLLLKTRPLRHMMPWFHCQKQMQHALHCSLTNWTCTLGWSVHIQRGMLQVNMTCITDVAQRQINKLKQIRTLLSWKQPMSMSHQTRLYSFRFSWRIVSLTAAKTNLMFSVSVYIENTIKALMTTVLWTLVVEHIKIVHFKKINYITDDLLLKYTPSHE